MHIRITVAITASNYQGLSESAAMYHSYTYWPWNSAKFIVGKPDHSVSSIFTFHSNLDSYASRLTRLLVIDSIHHGSYSMLHNDH